MSRKARPWKCRKKSCGNVNRVGTRKCQKCGKPRPAKREQAHKKVLKDRTYEDFVKLNGGDFCWICEYLGLPERPRLFRDHDHKTGLGRGILCYIHNRYMPDRFSIEELEAFVAYLKKHLTDTE